MLRVGRRLVIRPTWREHEPLPGDVVVALDPGMAFGTGLHPTTRLCLAGIERSRTRGGLDGGARPRRRLRLGDPGDRGRCGSAPAEALGVDTDPIAIEATLANAAPQRARAARSRRARARCRAASRRSTSSSPTSSPASSSRWRRSLRAELGAGGALLASGIFIDREAEVVAAFEAAGLRDRGPRRRGRLGRAGGPARPDRLRSGAGRARLRPTIAGRCPPYFPFLLGTHILLAVSLFLPSILLPFSLRARRAADGSPNRVVRFLLLMQSNGTVVIGLGLAVTGHPARH